MVGVALEDCEGRARPERESATASIRQGAIWRGRRGAGRSEAEFATAGICHRPIIVFGVLADRPGGQSEAESHTSETFQRQFAPDFHRRLKPRDPQSKVSNVSG